MDRKLTFGSWISSISPDVESRSFVPDSEPRKEFPSEQSEFLIIGYWCPLCVGPYAECGCEVA